MERICIYIFPKKEKVSSEYMKWCSTLFTIREMQIKATMRYLTFFRVVFIKKTGRHQETLVQNGGNFNWYSYHGKKYGNSSKI